MFNSIGTFIPWFYSTFIQPIFDLLRNTVVLGFSLFYWVFGFTVLAIGVRFVGSFLHSNDK